MSSSSMNTTMPAVSLAGSDKPVNGTPTPIQPVPAGDQENGLGTVHSGNIEMGLNHIPASQSQIGVPGGVVLNEHQLFVMDLPLSIQRGFRIKLFTILILQLCITLLTAVLLRAFWPDTADGEPGITVAFPAQSVQTLVLGFVLVIALPMITAVRDKHPWNMVITTLWSICWGFFLAAAHVPGGLVRSHTLYVVFGACAVGVFFLLLFSAFLTTTDEVTGDKVLISFSAAGTWAYVLMLIASIIFYTQTTQYYDSIGHFIGGLILATGIFFWVVWDSAKLCERMQPDDYMKGVVYFYTDFLTMCCCCLCAACMSTASS